VNATRPQRPATRADVARLAGVSTAVVSYVINDGPRPVAAATRDRVLAAVDQLGYRPNASARALKLGGTRTIGLMLSEIVNPFHSECIDALDAAATARGYSMLLASTHNDETRQAQMRADLVDRGVEGLVFLSLYPDRKDAPRASGGDVPQVIIDRSIPTPGFSTVGSDARAGATLAVSHLLEHGHRSIAYMEGPLDPLVGDERRVGWERALAHAGLTPEHLATTSWDRRGGAEAARHFMGLSKPPTAIFAGSDLMAIGALQALHELDRDVPADVAVISFDGTAESEYSWPPLTTVRHRYRDVADAAVAVLAERRGTPTAALFEMDIIVRASCGCTPASH